MAKLGTNIRYIRRETGEVISGIVIADDGQRNRVYILDGERTGHKWDVYPENKLEEVCYADVLAELECSKLYTGFLYNKRMEKIFRQLPYRRRADGWNVCVPMELLNDLQTVIIPVDIVGKDCIKYG